MSDVAKALKMPYTTYINYEKGYREPHSEVLIRMAEYYNVSLDYLLNNDGQISSDELDEMIVQLRTRPELRTLFRLAAYATREDIEKATRVVEAIMNVK